MADGTSDKASEKYKKMLPAGMVLIKWPEDVDRGERCEKETQGWRLLLPKKFNKHQQYGWRFNPRDVPCVAPLPEPEARGRAA